MANPTVLTSWKEIATYLGKSVRTVQRWEEAVGLPVRRRNGSDRNLVIALPHELDAWLQCQFQPRARVHHSRELERMHRLLVTMLDQSERIHKNTAELMKRLQQTRRLHAIAEDKSNSGSDGRKESVRSIAA